MKKFRLKMARQTGEKVAKENGFHKLPIDPFVIASNEQILVQAKSPEKKGMSGCFIFNDDGVAIIYSTDIKSEGYKNFTVAHELGHYFLDGHPETIRKNGDIHYSKAGFIRGGQSIEIEADHFAAGLLMPSELVRKKLLKESIGFEGIQALSQEAKTSLVSSAIRAAELAPYPLAIIVSKEKNISYGFLSESFKKLGISIFPRKGMCLPQTGTLKFNGDRANVKKAERCCCISTLSDWFGGERELELDEEIIGLGSFGYTLTVLSSESFASDSEEDEQEELQNSWTPKFAYGR